jgi:hypothetical protein
VSTVNFLATISQPAVKHQVRQKFMPASAKRILTALLIPAKRVRSAGEESYKQAATEGFTDYAPEKV